MLAATLSIKLRSSELASQLMQPEQLVLPPPLSVLPIDYKTELIKASWEYY